MYWKKQCRKIWPSCFKVFHESWKPYSQLTSLFKIISCSFLLSATAAIMIIWIINIPGHDVIIIFPRLFISSLGSAPISLIIHPDPGLSGDDGLSQSREGEIIFQTKTISAGNKSISVLSPIVEDGWENYNCVTQWQKTDFPPFHLFSLQFI